MVNDSERSKKKFLTDEGTILTLIVTLSQCHGTLGWDEQEERRETWKRQSAVTHS